MSDETFTTESDPKDFTVDQVNDYLATADDAERERVLDAERTGQARKGIVGDESPAPQGGLETKAETFDQAAEKAVAATGEAYEQGYFGHAPSRDGDNPVDLTLAGVTGQNKDA